MNSRFDMGCADDVAGVDEVGRGALFGPVVAAAVMLTPNHGQQLLDLGLTDSKKLTAKQRDYLFDYICQGAIACRVGLASVAEIDRLNILQASLLAMKRAVMGLSPLPRHCLVDGNQPIPHLSLSQQTIVKGDQLALPIAAASVVAKVWRDRLITRMADRFPGYGLASNKGYGTQSHRNAISTIGLSRYHRRSFKPCQINNPTLSGQISSHISLALTQFS
ncbi:MAG: ribonuclease HII [Leptolyngbyaceae bacterium]|nr:ribonuclease HII [Leptolyngbyaceae bacterium]